MPINSPEVYATVMSTEYAVDNLRCTLRELFGDLQRQKKYAWMHIY